MKCTADAGLFYRQVYPGVVVRGYFCPPVQQPYWNTIYLDNCLDEEFWNMIDHAYNTILHSISKKVQKQIFTVDEVEIRCMMPEEYPLLEYFLYDAIYLPEGASPPPRKVIRQQGIGSKLMKEMIALLKSRGYRRASLSVNKDNYACQMYGKLGFGVIKEQEYYLMLLELF